MHHEAASTSNARSNITSSQGSKSSEQSDGSSQQASRCIYCKMYITCICKRLPIVYLYRRSNVDGNSKTRLEFWIWTSGFSRCFWMLQCAKMLQYLYASVVDIISSHFWIMIESSPPGRMIRRHLLESSK